MLFQKDKFIFVFMPPTLKKMKGHFALGLSVPPSVTTLRYGFEIS